MHIRSLKLAYFSPTGTSASVAGAIAQGCGLEAEHIDLTREPVRAHPVRLGADDLLVLAVPVYSGRVPVLLEGWLKGLSLNGAPVACVVVYGNREYDDALLELSDTVREQGGAVVACGAFIGEHSFSSTEYPVAVARPDAADLAKGQEFGRKVLDTLNGLDSAQAARIIEVPGNRPYKELKPRGPLDFIAVSDVCVECGTCAELCPVGAIVDGAYTETDGSKCIMCCACIKGCPERARTMKEGFATDIARRLAANCAERKEPVWFF
ncbi:EFR1 family ferrodoxin [Pseudodesulfovibrio indicus]|uniref:4Fe-4S binding protein n=1 Tax=Pseudodesulfovibrio indicus TaxID=1716143 RepID=A0A126QNE0_9BACT|nr:EFR1 family ferrodoxin [Pseudodesulfovibrio indicus]AMK11441.1 ferredoxin [Pseudodesulfovibrio indicus]TDT89834.1 4Fe-4S binding protein [Pseudodesulfovibrio indicus]